MAAQSPLPVPDESPTARKIREARQHADAAHEQAAAARRVAKAAREDAQRIRESMRTRRLLRGIPLEPLEPID
jgi:hypothetical protein